MSIGDSTSKIHRFFITIAFITGKKMKLHQKNRIAVIVALIFTASCCAQERIVFACQISSGANVQLTKVEDGRLHYSFIRQGRTELSYKGANFEYHEYSRPMTSYAGISFTLAEFKYEIYSEYDAQLSADYHNGIRIFNNSAESLISNLACTKVDVDNIRELSEEFPCDKDKPFC